MSWLPFRDEDQSRETADSDILTREVFATEFGGESFEPDPDEAGLCAPVPCPRPERAEGRVFRAAGIPRHHDDAGGIFLLKLGDEISDSGVAVAEIRRVVAPGDDRPLARVVERGFSPVR